jgi:transcriptional regulator GlxA family with amidase domain
MQKLIAILIFDGAEEMDFVGPFEVLAAAAENNREWCVRTVAETMAPICCEKGMRVLPDHTYAEINHAEIVVIPGGSGARREIANPATVAWLQSIEQRCRWMTSVCTGAFLLVGSGLAKGRRVTTHHQYIHRLRDMGGAEIIEGMRFVRDGKFVSAGGVMSGIEMSLWLVEQIWGVEVVEKTKSYIAYDFPERSRSTDKP